MAHEYRENQDSQRESRQEQSAIYRRRVLLQGALGLAGSALLAACGGAAPSTTAPTASAVPSSAPTVPPTAPAAGGTATVPSAGGGATTTPTAGATAGRGTVAATPSRPAGSPAAAGSPVAIDGRIPSPAPGVPDAYLKEPPPFKSVAGIPGKGGKLTTFQIAEGKPVTARGDNLYWQELEKRIGVQQLDVVFGPTASWAEKFATLTAGGDLPDLCWLYPQDPRAGDQYKTILQGAFTDLTPYLNPEARKEYPNLAKLPDDAWQNIQINKKIYGVPRALFLVPTLIFRQDWADKANLSQPKNGDEFARLMTGFSKGDPDGNGQADTWGLGGFNARPMSLDFIRYMYRVPDGWRRNPDDTLTAAYELPEYRESLAYARRLWEAGAYHPDTPTMTTSQARDAMIAGKLGAFQDSITGLPGRRTSTRQNNPAADLRCLVPPGYDGGQGVVYKGAGHVGFTAISAKAGKDQGKVKELLRILDYYASPFGSEERNFLTYGIEGVQHTVNENGVRLRNDRGVAEIGDLPNLSFQPPVFYYAGELDLAPYMQGLLRDLYAIGIDNPTLAYYSPTNATKAAELNSFVSDKQLAFITGREPLSGVDAFVRDWKSRGGDQIRKEYEQALKS